MSRQRRLLLSWINQWGQRGLLWGIDDVYRNHVLSVGPGMWILLLLLKSNVHHKHNELRSHMRLDANNRQLRHVHGRRTVCLVPLLRLPGSGNHMPLHAGNQLPRGHVQQLQWGLCCLRWSHESLGFGWLRLVSESRHGRRVCDGGADRHRPAVCMCLAELPALLSNYHHSNHNHNHRYDLNIIGRVFVNCEHAVHDNDHT